MAWKQISSIAVKSASRRLQTAATWRSMKSTSTVTRGFLSVKPVQRPLNERRMSYAIRDRWGIINLCTLLVLFFHQRYIIGGLFWEKFKLEIHLRCMNEICSTCAQTVERLLAPKLLCCCTKGHTRAWNPTSAPCVRPDSARTLPSRRIKGKQVFFIPLFYRPAATESARGHGGILFLMPSHTALPRNTYCTPSLKPFIVFMPAGL